jgi:hypothetical protein
MQMLRPFFFRSGTQPFPQSFRALRAGEQSVQQGSQVQPGTPRYNRQRAALADFLNSFPAFTRVFPGSGVSSGFDFVQQVMPNAGQFFSGWLGGPYAEFAVDRDRIAVDDLSVEARGDFKR